MLVTLRVPDPRRAPIAWCGIAVTLDAQPLTMATGVSHEAGSVAGFGTARFEAAGEFAASTTVGEGT